jgi:hypothetical protein
MEGDLAFTCYIVLKMSDGFIRTPIFVSKKLLCDVNSVVILEMSVPYSVHSRTKARN